MRWSFHFALILWTAIKFLLVLESESECWLLNTYLCFGDKTWSYLGKWKCVVPIQGNNVKSCKIWWKGKLGKLKRELLIFSKWDTQNLSILAECKKPFFLHFFGDTLQKNSSGCQSDNIDPRRSFNCYKLLYCTLYQSYILQCIMYSAQICCPVHIYCIFYRSSVCVGRQAFLSRLCSQLLRVYSAQTWRVTDSMKTQFPPLSRC